MFAFGCGYLLAKHWRTIEGVPRGFQMFRMMMPVHVIKLLGGHAEVFGRFPLRRAELHQPGRRGMPQDMRRDPGKPDGARQRAEGLVYVLDRLPIPFDRVGLSQALPAPQMRKQAIGKRNRRAPLLSLPLSRWTP